LVEAAMVGGTYLRRDGVSLTAATAAYEGTVASIDQFSGKLTLDPAPPAKEIDGELFVFGKKPHIVGEQIDVDEDGGFRLRRNCELFRSPIVRVDEASNSVVPLIAMPVTAGSPDIYDGTTAYNEAHDRSWRVNRTEVTEMWIPVLVPISEEEITDADGDGRRTVRLTGFAPPELTRDPVILWYGPFEKPVRMKQYNRPPFEEPVVLDVTRVDSERRRLYFKPPQDHDLVWNGWVYEGVTISNESGNRQWRGNYPAREFRIVLEGNVRDQDFQDAPTLSGSAPDGFRRIHIYDFGAGDPFRSETRIAVKRSDDGKYQVSRNVEGSVTIAGNELK
jgi:hypothetical protein